MWASAPAAATPYFQHGQYHSAQEVLILGWFSVVAADTVLESEFLLSFCPICLHPYAELTFRRDWSVFPEISGLTELGVGVNERVEISGWGRVVAMDYDPEYE